MEKQPYNYSKLRKKVGLQRSVKNQSEKEIIEIDLSKIIEIDIEWTGKLSKNVILGRGNFGKRFYMKQEARNLKEEIGWLVRQQTNKKNINFVNGKVWLDIFVQKPTAGSGDAINTLDLIADAISEAIGIDDKWFCVKAIDWEIKKQNPRIFIQIGQGDHEPQHICSFCGIIQGISNFNKIKEGYSRLCNHCRKASHKN